ncbi:MAG: glycosyltransferase [Saprospiraceae bacterium]|nr:glycosyltransferase [Saprospiraceae bacterium]
MYICLLPKDPNQAVSGTFSYAISCGCPIISTPIPHAKEVLSGDNGIIFDFGNVAQLTQAVIRLLSDEDARYKIGLSGLHRMASTAWENSAIAHGKVLQKLGKGKLNLRYSLPEINLFHINDMTTSFGIIQFAKINRPDILAVIH